MKNKTTYFLPTHVKYNNWVLSDQKEICLYPVNHASQFTLQPISPSDVANALKTIDPRKLTGADKLEPLFLKFSTPLITEQVTYI